MASLKSERTIWMAASLVFLGSVVMIGCNKNQGDAASSAGGPGNPALIAAGQTVFANNGCARCHSIGGQGGGRAPDLTKVGAEPGHTQQGLVEHVKNPRAHNPGSRMPAFEGKISDPDLNALGAYLASLK